jgi:hypothetical protein
LEVFRKCQAFFTVEGENFGKEWVKMVKKWAAQVSSTPRLLLSLVNKPEKKGENRPTFSHKALRISRSEKHRDKSLCLMPFFGH